jgi:hypothetical protein
LEEVARLVAAGGRAPQASKRVRSPKFKGVRQGTAFLMLAIVLLPLVDLIPDPFHEALIFVLLLAGAARIVFALLFQEGESAAIASDPAEPSEVVREELPAAGVPRTTARIRELAMPANDNSIASGPPTVTEGTTKLLSEDPPIERR